MSERQPIRGPALLVASLLFLTGAIAFVLGGMSSLVNGVTPGGALHFLVSVVAFGWLLHVLTKKPSR